MDITEVRVKLMEEPGERLQAFCSITFDDAFVVRDLKIIEGVTGSFVAMPSRKLTTHCQQCGSKNHLRANFCNQCGKRTKDSAASRDDDGRAKLYADIAHPINSSCREMIQRRVIEAFDEERSKSQLPGYVPSYEDFDSDGFTQTPTSTTRIQGAEKPHGPHKTPAEKTHSVRSASQKEEFGAGIFD